VIQQTYVAQTTATHTISVLNSEPYALTFDLWN